MTVVRGAFFAGCLFLTACGGGGGGVGSTPTPPPVPAVVYKSFENLTSSETFTATGAEVSFFHTSATSQIGSVGGREGFNNAPTLTIEYNATDKTYAIKDVGFNHVFGPSDLYPDTASPAYFLLYGKGDGTDEQYFQIYNANATSIPNNPAPVDVSYVTFGYWADNDNMRDLLNNISGTQKIAYFVTGFETVPTDMPRTGSAYYYGHAEAFLAHDGAPTPGGPGTRELLRGSARLTADFALSNVSTELNLNYTTRVDPVTNSLLNFGTLKGTGNITTDSAKFGGDIGGAGYGGKFDGAFYGPKAKEMGYVFIMTDAAGGVINGLAIGK